MRRPYLTVILPILVVGVLGTAVAAITRSDADSAFAYRQQGLTAITPGVLEHFVATAKDPRPGSDRHAALRATCVPLGYGEFRNPWDCAVRYPVGPVVHYRVNIDPTGRVSGSDRTGTLVISGCCVGTRPPS